MTDAELAPTRLVVAAIIVDSLEEPRTLFTARRSDHNLWEFPGGKVDPGETPVEALHREIREELGISIRLGEEFIGPDVAGPMTTNPDQNIGACWELAPAGARERLVMRLWWAVVDQGEPTLDIAHNALTWLEPGQWRDGVEWLPADYRIVEAAIEHAVAENRKNWC